jgi:hypothetical protein
MRTRQRLLVFRPLQERYELPLRFGHTPALFECDTGELASRRLCIT